ncbi:hypothetical protein BDV27DRAFT_165833 [Aspergillus caelatus]|uniref:Secreted protein n=2 Tax=Aspergillus subgen. Circumdati TaxID=2720871 RepID=A0A5N7AHG0_9EURO|nr:uncharacterized protein BDV27DRAFT_165833 [Aspergillus caelatus]KAE8369302.1 hypothetical protein BDV27DRAFT_165833 [Aspergillus caelatus]KAE8415226.1 hypothetical protein BDV36DRAFT_311185 [Aspergillus pseudocaelatus]
MKSFNFLWLLAAGLITQVQADESPIEGYSIEEFSWEVETTPGGPTVVLNGTVEKVLSQLREINPNYEAEFATVVPEIDQPAEHAAEEEDTSSHLAKRGDVVCGKFPSAYQSDIDQGIKYLRSVPGKPQRGPGPGSCGQVSCSWSSAIWWCNDNTFTKVLPSFNNIADGAQLIKNTCLHGGQTFSGQDFHNDKWNTIVRFHKC